MHRIVIVVLCLLMGVSLSAAAGSDQGAIAKVDPSRLKLRIIDLHRKAGQAFNALLSVVEQRWMYNVISPNDPRPQTEELKLYSDLYFAASFTKGLSEGVCLDRTTNGLCGAAFDPKWLLYPRDANPTFESIAAQTTETEAALEPLWQGLCKLASDKAGKPACGPPPA